MEENSYIIRALDKEDKYFRRFERGAARFTADIEKAASYRQRNTATIAAVITIAAKPEKESSEPLRWAIIDNEFIEYTEEAING